MDLTKLNFDKLGLYGRDKEVAILRQAYRTAIPEDTSIHDNSNSEIVFVAGYSGVGKSTLISHALEEQQPDSALRRLQLYVTGKFEQRRATEPYLALGHAFAELCRLMLESGERQRFSEAIREAVGTQGQVLIDIFPTIGAFIGETEERTEAIGVSETLVQVKYGLRSVLAAVSRIRPVILVLDDLQWADQASLDLIASITTFPGLNNFLFIGAYRDNEVTSSSNQEHPLIATINVIRNYKLDGPFIQLESFNQDTVNHYIAKLLDQTLEETSSLSSIVFAKTKGNVFFLKQLLENLAEKNILEYSIRKYRWQWDIERATTEVDISDNVVETVAGKIQRLPPGPQRVVTTAAALAAQFDSNVLGVILDDLQPNDTKLAQKDLAEALDLAVEEGLFEKSGASYRFSHDRIQQAAYSLIFGVEDREKLHLSVGQTVWSVYKSMEIPNPQMLFVVVDQMNLGYNQIDSEERRLELADLNLQAGLNAKRVSAFFPASQYFRTGIQLLGRQAWEFYYGMALQLHVEAAEVTCSSGQHDQALDLAHTVLNRPKAMDSDLERDADHRASICIVASLGALGKLLEAISFGRKHILNLGEKLPKKVGLFAMLSRLVKTKGMIKKLSDEDILSLPPMTDKKIIQACFMYQKISVSCFFAGRTLDMAFMLFRLVQLTIKYGLGELSPFAFGTFGFVISGMGQVKEGYRYGKLALALLDIVKSRRFRPMTESMVYVFVIPWQKPVQDCLEPVLDCFKKAMEVGDSEYSSSAIISYLTLYNFCGLPLGSLDHDMHNYICHMIDYKQENYAEATICLHQGVRNLIEMRDDPVCLDGSLLMEEDFLMRHKTSNNASALQQFYLAKFQLAFYFDKLEEARKMGNEFFKICDSLKSHNQYWMFTFLDCMLHVELYQKTKKRAHRRQAIKRSKEIEKWVKLGNVNVVHKLMIVQAALLSLTGKTQEVKEAYGKAIAASSRIGYAQDSALASERLGRFFLKKRENQLALDNFGAAYDKYMAWGATAKADHLRRKVSWLGQSCSMHFSDSSSKNYSAVMRGRPRYDRTVSSLHRRLNNVTASTIQNSSISGSVTSDAPTKSDMD